MLTESDIEFIRLNRSEITANRTEPVVLVRVGETDETVAAVFKMPKAGGGRTVTADELGNADLYQTSVTVSFDGAVSLDNAYEVQRGSRRYVLTDVDERGLGGKNRFECEAEEIRVPTQSITVTKADGLDDWGEPVPGAIVSYTAYIVEGTNVVANQYGEEAVCQLRILINGIVDVSYDDKIAYTNELAISTVRVPVKINVKRRVNGRPMLTEVFV